ncbi:Zinc finger SWIM domain-containing protein 8 [Amphibalanus amphitrite]|uniref:Zinc finger SWIM domain-containing protein 8 n=1 Tax=Amphibalanus amphitrite TaxID=1232801 RepID=A0A6A4X0U7_AMPAM|nr:Zinc finger SWIM domain-containing protein 8 [Amphibalanus amphitrite]
MCHTNPSNFPPSLPQQPVPRILGSPPLKYLFSTYRVGMLAMETLARRVHDDRATKYSPTPPYGDDVMWLMRVAMKLGTPYVHQFCLCAVNSVVSPFVLFEIASDVGSYLSRHNTAPPYRSQILTPLVQQCQQMFLSCMHVRLCHVTPPEYDEFVAIVRKARQAFSMTAGGPTQLQEFLQVHRRNKLVKKELWLRITIALQQTAA